MGDEEPARVPDPRRAEWSLAIAKISMSFVPVIGAAAAELLSAIVTPRLEKRRTAWFEEVANGLYEHAKRELQLTPERLSENDEWISAFLSASQAALRTHQTEKLDAFRNAVLNVATGTRYDEDWVPVFLTWIEVFTPWHLRVLRFIDDPHGVAAAAHVKSLDNYGGDGEALLVEVFPELRLKRLFYRRVINDLATYDLIDVDADRIGSMLVAGQAFLSRTTRIGKVFLQFITAPDGEAE